MSLEKVIDKIFRDIEHKAKYDYLENIRNIHVDIALNHFTWEKATNWNDLVRLLKDSNKYDKFDKKYQYIAGSAYLVTLENLANWLLRKSKQIGISAAIECLDNYNNSDRLTLYVIMTVMSLRPYDEYIFSNGVQLLNQENVSKINKKLSEDLLLDSIRSSVPSPFISSIFAYPIEKKIKHENSREHDQEEDSDYIQGLRKINSVKECLILSRGLNGIHTMAHKYIIPDKIPLVSTASGTAWGFETFYLPKATEPFIKIEELNEADRILVLYENLESSLTESIKVSIERLNGYCSSSSYIERAINIRTCLESVFLNDNEVNEISSTLALRVSRFTGKTIDERKEIYKLVKDCYSITSKAVHRGNIPDKQMKNISKLDHIAEICRKVIIQKVERGTDIDWKEIELN